jgi:hypothetical protein
LGLFHGRDERRFTYCSYTSISEGVLLSLLGGLAGLALAYVLARLNAHFSAPTIVPMEFYAGLDWHAGVFAFALAIVCGVGFSLAPALQATKTDLTQALKEGSALQLPGYRRHALADVAKRQGESCSRKQRN